jgi:hypothetical protein
MSSKRSNLSSYSWFYDDVLSNVVGRIHWSKQSLHTRGTELASVSDEALGLLIVDNCWASWSIRSEGRDEPEDVLVEALANDDPAGVSGKDWANFSKAQQLQARKSRARVILGLTKYTTKTSGTKGTGWTEEGLNRFNELCTQVVEDRKMNGGTFDDYYMEHKKNNKTGRRDRGSRPTLRVPVYDDLSD